MESSSLPWLLVALLLTDCAVGHKLSGPPPHSQMALSLAPPPSHSPQDTLRSLLSDLSTSVQGRVRFHGDVSCSSLRRLPRGDTGDSPMALELLGLAELPLLLSAGCHQEALSLTRGLYKALGREDTHTAIRQLTHLLRSSVTLPTAENNHTATSPGHSVHSQSENESVYTSGNSGSSQGNATGFHNSTDSQHFVSNVAQFSTMPHDETQAECHMSALMFNIQQLARVGKGDMFSSSSSSSSSSPSADGGSESCSGWLHVQGAQLLGQRVGGKRGHRLHKAQHLCQSLGPQCVGVAQVGGPESGLYQAVLGGHSSRVLPSPTDAPTTDCWLRRCVSVSESGLGVVRVRRDAPPGGGRMSWRNQCVNHQEQQVYAVVEWVPAVSTLYNLGTAVYYAARNCTDTARERAILSAVDLGTDALMAITGGTVGVAGYALGAGVKTGVKAGVKYMMNNMNQEEYSPYDVFVNQESWEDGVMTIQ